MKSTIEFHGDIFVTSQIAAITRCDDTVQVTLKREDTSFDYEFNNEDEAKREHDLMKRKFVEALG